MNAQALRGLSSVTGGVCVLTGVLYALVPESSLRLMGVFAVALAVVFGVAFGVLGCWQARAIGRRRHSLVILLGLQATGFACLNGLGLLSASFGAVPIPTVPSLAGLLLAVVLAGACAREALLSACGVRAGVVEPGWSLLAANWGASLDPVLGIGAVAMVSVGLFVSFSALAFGSLTMRYSEAHLPSGDIYAGLTVAVWIAASATGAAVAMARAERGRVAAAVSRRSVGRMSVVCSLVIITGWLSAFAATTARADRNRHAHDRPSCPQIDAGPVVLPSPAPVRTPSAGPREVLPAPRPARCVRRAPWSLQFLLLYTGVVVVAGAVGFASIHTRQSSE